jgi:hypothetical protein
MTPFGSGPNRMVATAVARTHREGDIGIIRIMFPDNSQSEHSALIEISWEQFFEEFEEKKLALIFGEDGVFGEIVGRDHEGGKHMGSR